MRRDGTVEFVRRDTDWHDVRDKDEAFYLRIAFAGGYRYPGADLGISRPVAACRRTSTS